MKKWVKEKKEEMSMRKKKEISVTWDIWGRDENKRKEIVCMYGGSEDNTRQLKVDECVSVSVSVWTSV